MCEIESDSFCLGKEKLRRIIAVTPGKKSSVAWNNQLSHNTHTGEKQETKKGERTGREVAITVVSWLPVGLDTDIVYKHIWKRCYIIILILMLWWAQTKRGWSLTYCSLTNGCSHWLLLCNGAEMRMNYQLLFCRVRCSDHSTQDAHAEHQNPVEMTIVLFYRYEAVLQKPENWDFKSTQCSLITKHIWLVLQNTYNS